jgi:hypothetical protein
LENLPDSSLITIVKRWASVADVYKLNSCFVAIRAVDFKRKIRFRRHPDTAKNVTIGGKNEMQKRMTINRIQI